MLGYREAGRVLSLGCGRFSMLRRVRLGRGMLVVDC